MYKVSVIVPIYGVERYIERCARSLFEQTLSDMEFIFVDDSTKDNSMAVLERVLREYPDRMRQTKILHHEENKGLPLARKTGIDCAEGEFIAHCDSDDWVNPRMYEEMYLCAQREDADIVVCDFEISDGNTSSCYKKGIFSSDSTYTIIRDICREKSRWSVWNKIVKRSLYVDGFVYPQYNMGEDMVYMLQLFLLSKKISVVKEPLYFYFLNPNSIMREVSKERVITNYDQLVNNFNSLLGVFQMFQEKTEYASLLDCIYYRISYNLLSNIADDDVYSLWRKHFQDKHLSFLLNKDISIKRKVRHLMIFLKIYKR